VAASIPSVIRSRMACTRKQEPWTSATEYELLMRYIREFNLQLADVPKNSKQVVFARGKRYVVPAGQEPDWPLDLKPEERKLGKAGLWKKYVPPALAEIGDTSSSGWPSSNALKYDATIQ